MEALSKHATAVPEASAHLITVTILAGICFRSGWNFSSR